MCLAGLRQLPHPEEQDDYLVEIDAFEYVEPVIYPSTDGATVYVYFDEDRFRDDKAIDTIIEDYQRRYPATVFQSMLIRRQELQNRRYFAFPITERGFVKDGYAQNLTCEREVKAR